MRRISPPVTIPAVAIPIAADRRSEDRRRFGWRTILNAFFRSRRRVRRRQDDTTHPFIDWHHPWLFFLGVGVMMLSAADAFFTLRLIEGGAVEVNPFMKRLIDTDTFLFVSTKLLVTGVGLMTLVFASQVFVFRRIRVGVLVTAVFCLYACLICYQYIGLMALGIL